MAYARTALDAHDLSPRTQAAKTQTTKRGFWQRFFAAMVSARQRQAEREIALYLRGNGGKFTDDAEREIERRFLGSTRW